MIKQEPDKKLIEKVILLFNEKKYLEALDLSDNIIFTLVEVSTIFDDEITLVFSIIEIKFLLIHSLSEKLSGFDVSMPLTTIAAIILKLNFVSNDVFGLLILQTFKY